MGIFLGSTPISAGTPDSPQDGTVYGRKDGEWVDITAPANLQVRRGTEAEVAAITPLDGEPVWATDTKRLVVGDGATAGGISVGGALCAYSSGALLLDDGDPASDPEMELLLPVAGAYYVKVVFVFFSGGTSDLTIYLPSDDLSYIHGVSSNDLDPDYTISVSGEEVWQREFLCVTTENGVLISPQWSTVGDPLDRTAGYIVAVPCS
jgi:hypothetical protein